MNTKKGGRIGGTPFAFRNTHLTLMSSPIVSLLRIEKACITMGFSTYRKTGRRMGKIHLLPFIIHTYPP